MTGSFADRAWATIRAHVRDCDACMGVMPQVMRHTILVKPRKP